MRYMRRASRALKSVPGAVKTNVEIHGNTVPHLHAHSFRRHAGDRIEGGPRLPDLSTQELEDLAVGLRTARAGD